jgi:hypothetical protein
MIPEVRRRQRTCQPGARPNRSNHRNGFTPAVQAVVPLVCPAIPRILHEQPGAAAAALLQLA